MDDFIPTAPFHLQEEVDYSGGFDWGLEDFWPAQPPIDFEDLLLPEDVDDTVLRDLCYPRCKETLLLYGPPGTGKTQLAIAIVRARCSAAKQQDKEKGTDRHPHRKPYKVDYLSGADLGHRAYIGNGKLAEGYWSHANGGGEEHCVIIDEIDRLNAKERDGVIDYINEFQRGKLQGTVIATTNIDLGNPREVERVFRGPSGEAMLSRLDHKVEITTQPFTRFLPLIKSKLDRNKVCWNLEEIAEVAEAQGLLDGDTSFRAVRIFTTKLWRSVRSEQERLRKQEAA